MKVIHPTDKHEMAHIHTHPQKWKKDRKLTKKRHVLLYIVKENITFST